MIERRARVHSMRRRVRCAGAVLCEVMAATLTIDAENAALFVFDARQSFLHQPRTVREEHKPRKSKWNKKTSKQRLLNRYKLALRHRSLSFQQTSPHLSFPAILQLNWSNSRQRSCNCIHNTTTRSRNSDIPSTISANVCRTWIALMIEKAGRSALCTDRGACRRSKDTLAVCSR